MTMASAGARAYTVVYANEVFVIQANQLFVFNVADGFLKLHDQLLIISILCNIIR